jgi:lauroyl/myristoyl acyltransferase
MKNLKIKRQMRFAIELGRLIGTLAYWIDAPHRLTGRRNLGLAFPDWSKEKIRRISRRVFQNLGATLVEKGALPDMRRALRNSQTVGLLVDQSRRKESVDVNFFGHRVPATPAAAFLGLRCNSPILTIFCIRDACGQLTIHVDEPLNLKWSGDLRADVQANTQLITDAVGRMIRRYPDQWFWVHKRWKKYYPQLYPEYHAHKNRRQKREGHPVHT